MKNFYFQTNSFKSNVLQNFVTFKLMINKVTQIQPKVQKTH